MAHMRAATMRSAVLARARSRAVSSRSWYAAQLEERPVLTKSVTSGCISLAGDAICQWNENEGMHLRRAASMGAMGCFLIGPALHTWYNALARLAPGNSVSQVARRVVLDQLGFAPVLVPTSLATVFLLEGRDDVFGRVSRMLWPTLLSSWTVWIPAQAFNFALIPVQHQVLFANGVALGWNVYLSSTTHKKVDSG